MRHRRSRPSYRVPYWQRRVAIMERIDEIVHIANEDDRYGEPHIFEEPDADGRWELHVTGYSERRRSSRRVEAPSHVENSRAPTTSSQQYSLSDDLAARRPDNASNAAADGARGFGQDEARDIARAEDSSLPSGSGAHFSESSTEARPFDTQNNTDRHSDMADRNEENNENPQSFNTTDSDASESDSSDDEDVDAEAEAGGAELERIFQLFEDVPTCIQKARHLPAIDSDEHGIMAVSNPESGWNHIDRAKLPPRIQKFLAEFTLQDAAAFPDGAYPGPELNGDSHRWLLATPRKEFICDTSTLDVWYRSLAQTYQANSPQQPL